MSKRISYGFFLFLNLFSLSLLAQDAPSEWGLNMPKGVTDVSNVVYSLHMKVFLICCLIGLVVFGAMIYSIIMHRKSKGAVPAQFHHSTSLEILWTAIPVLILFYLAYVATAPLIEIEDTSKADITIKATGYQWYWGYEYLDVKLADDPEKNLSFTSYLDSASSDASQLNSDTSPESVENYLLNVDNAMVVPVGKKVQMLLTGTKVIHAWWVPELGGKKDAIPGFVNELWFRANKPGVYRGQCAELCGQGHGFMPIVVKAVSDDEYAAWIAEMQKGTPIDYNTPYSKETLMADGKKSYDKVCKVCHQENGAGIPGAFPALLGDSIAVGDLDEHIDIVINGREGTGMASFATLNDYEIASIITYERNAWGNDTGDVIQPAQIRDRK